jgi:circadian clock protein KaiC
MTPTNDLPRVPTGVRNLDALLGGGLPKGSVSVVGGPPGAGKTILAQQICFHNATDDHPALYFSTLSEPTAKTLRYLSRFAYCDVDKIHRGAVKFVDLGVILRSDGLEEATKLIMRHVKAARPSVVVIDSFKVFDDLARSRQDIRKFSYELAVNLMAWEVTALLLGEYGPIDVERTPLFSVVDGMVSLTQRELSGEQQRFIRVIKMRGVDHNRDDHPFQITSAGIEVFAPRVTLGREPTSEETPVERCRTGIARLDDLLGDGIPRGSTLLVSGVAGTGKTALLLEFIYRGALAGERGVVFSFEETPERLRATARGLGWDLDAQIERGMVELVFIPQPNIWVERHMLMMRERVEAMQARRMALDSLSVFLHKVRDPQICREKTFQLASIVQNTRAVGFFATDVPYGSDQISRFGVEETVVDGVILLSATEEGFERQRYLEVYKLRNTAHAKGRHTMVIGRGGVAIFPRYDAPTEALRLEPMETSRRLASGVPGLDELLGGGLLERSVTLISGSPGIGKSTLSLQFVAEGAARGETGIYVSFEEGPAQLALSAEAMGLPLADAIKMKRVEMVYLGGQRIRANQLLAILADRIVASKATRLVLDGAALLSESSPPEDLRQVLHGLITRFKALGVTSVLTVEASAMYSTETATEGQFSPIADNLVLLRYEDRDDELRRVLTVVKTRGSAHDPRRHRFSIGSGGLRVGEPVGGGPSRPGT